MYYIKFYSQDQFLFTHRYYTWLQRQTKIDLGIKLNRAGTSVLSKISSYQVYTISVQELNR